MQIKTAFDIELDDFKDFIQDIVEEVVGKLYQKELCFLEDMMNDLYDIKQNRKISTKLMRKILEKMECNECEINEFFIS